MFAKWIAAHGRFSFSLADNGGIEISAEEHRALSNPPVGKQLGCDVDGRPVLVDTSATPVASASISALDGLLALDAAGLSGAYDAWANSPDRTFAERAFIAKAQTWRRDDPTLNAAASGLGLTDAQVDALFASA